MRITKQKLMRLIKEELANEVSLDEVGLQGMASGLGPTDAPVGGAAAAQKEKSSVNPTELAKQVIAALKAGSPGEDKWLEALVRLFAGAASEGAVDPNSSVKRFTEMLMRALQDMTKDPEAEPEAEPEEEAKDELYDPESEYFKNSREHFWDGRKWEWRSSGRPISRRSPTTAASINEGKVTKSALEDLIKEAVAELINK